MKEDIITVIWRQYSCCMFMEWKTMKSKMNCLEWREQRQRTDGSGTAPFNPINHFIPLFENGRDDWLMDEWAECRPKETLQQKKNEAFLLVMCFPRQQSGRDWAGAVSFFGLVMSAERHRQLAKERDQPSSARHWLVACLLSFLSAACLFFSLIIKEMKNKREEREKRRRAKQRKRRNHKRKQWKEGASCRIELFLLWVMSAQRPSAAEKFRSID